MRYVVCLILLALLSVSCSDTDLGDDINGNNTLAVYSTVEDLPPCTIKNEGEQLFVKSEGIIRVCADEKWFATMERGGGCSTEMLKDSSGLKIVCDGDSVGVVLNGKNGSNGKNGILPDSSENDDVVLDSEKVATSLEGVSGYSQKGPFINGSKVTVIELESGRTLNQTGNTFESKIQSDDGQFKLNARMMVSQYVELHAEGYYRNEVSGGNSEAPLTLYALTDVRKRDGGIVNINLLTHLEYHRVVYLVKNKKMKVAAAKDSAEKEIFGLLNINSKDFFSSEDLNIAGSSEGDAALLAFSVMFQGNRGVADLTKLLTDVATDIEKDGSWDDVSAKAKIADWAENADATGRLETIRANVEDWGLSSMVPNFEKYIRSFWTKEYGLPTCDKDNVDKVVAAGAERLAESTYRYVCVDSAKVGYMWRRATDLEKDTYGWAAGTDGQIKNGDINTAVRYVYDAAIEKWREMTEAEGYYGLCTEVIEADTSKNVLFNKINKTGNEPYVVCENRQWVPRNAYYADTHFWEYPAEEGTVRRGKFTTNVYVYEQNLGFWRVGWLLESDLGMACVSINEGKKIHKQPLYEGDSDAYYTCRYHNDGEKPMNANGIDFYDEHYVETEYRWEADDYTIASNTFGVDCETEGQMIKGSVDDRYFVCNAGEWRYANTEEELQCRSRNFCQACTDQRAGVLQVLGDSVYVCATNYTYWMVTYISPDDIPGVCSYSNLHETLFDIETIGSNTVDWICTENGWKRADIYDYTWENFQIHLEKHKPSEITYGTLLDDRDGNVYKTIVIDGKEWMAENLRYADSNTTTNMKGNSWCWDDNPDNCRIGGRLYSWYAAVDFNQSWGSGASNLIQDQHQGICPHGWHIPSKDEWTSILGTFNGESGGTKDAIMAMGFAMDLGFADWKNARDLLGFGALPTGYRTANGAYYIPSQIAGYWTPDIRNGSEAYAYILPFFIVSMGYMRDMAVSWDQNDDNNGGVLFGNGLSVRCVKNYTLDGD